MISISNDRNCDGCTKCCEGWLTGSAHGYDFSPNKPCHFLQKHGCGIYEFRPYSPCKTFKCEWKQNKSIPEEFKPDKINAIFIKRERQDYTTLDVVEAGKPLSSEVLHFVIQLFQQNKYENIRYQHAGTFHVLGKNSKFIADNTE